LPFSLIGCAIVPAEATERGDGLLQAASSTAKVTERMAEARMI
jgi:hypothetical protein